MRAVTMRPGRLFSGIWLLSGLLAALCLESRAQALPPAAESLPGEIATHQADAPSAGEGHTYIVRLAGPPLASYAARLSSESGDAASEAAHESAVEAYGLRLDAQQEAFLAQLDAVAGPVEVIYHYRVAFNGLAVVLPDSAAEAVADLPNVLSVHRDQMRELALDDTSPAFLGMPGVWDSDLIGGVGQAGEGIVVGIIDSGIDIDHPAFADDGSYGAPPGDWDGKCVAPSDGSLPYACNNKVVGMQYFLDGYVGLVGSYDGNFFSARDDNGHGTHVAAIAAGNYAVESSIFGIARGTISGIAPRAHLSIYKAAGPGGSLTSDRLAAIDAAVADGVDVINYSIGNVAADPYTDDISQAFLTAYESGIFIAAAAGNGGPNPGTIGAPANAPWVFAVGATTFDRNYDANATLIASGSPPIVVDGASLTDNSAVVNYNLVDARRFTDSRGSRADYCFYEFQGVAFDENDAILCRYFPGIGPIFTTRQSYVVQFSGAGAMLLYNADPDVGQFARNHFVPTIHVDQETAGQILDYIEGRSGVQVSFGQATAKTAQADVMAYFSSRGPGSAHALKPDIVAPGAQILSATSPQPGPQPNVLSGGAPGELFQAISGTSMSSPHAAGVAALLKQLNPDLSPAEIASLIMTTAKTDGLVKQDGTTPANPLDYGAGRIDPLNALDGFWTWDVSAEEIRQADPADGGDPTTLNLPSLYNQRCIDVCSWTRTVRNSGDISYTVTLTTASPVSETLVYTLEWNADPDDAERTFGPDEEASFTLSVDASSLKPGWYYLSVILKGTPNPETTRQETAPDARLPVAFLKPAEVYLPRAQNQE